ncbi:unnamed protein product [Rhizoctonia solani]|uniref:N-acetyltransferase domain-containing protein n=1 Tax=Rhizoctonia solani TaxID=456999 RepID=A0A8H3GES2_9AGAM|nr:unnamed protein product [Rhizoctonia solani]
MQDSLAFPLLLSSSINTFRIEQVSWANLAGQKLRDEQVAEISARFGTAPADNIALFLLANPENTGEPVACGALRHLDDGFMEASSIHLHAKIISNIQQIKRMYATPKSRGTGAAFCVLLALEKYARWVGVKGLKLQTSTLQADAIR